MDMLGQLGTALFVDFQFLCNFTFVINCVLVFLSPLEI